MLPLTKSYWDSMVNTSVYWTRAYIIWRVQLCLLNWDFRQLLSSKPPIIEHKKEELSRVFVIELLYTETNCESERKCSSNYQNPRGKKLWHLAWMNIQQIDPCWRAFNCRMPFSFNVCLFFWKRDNYTVIAKHIHFRYEWTIRGGKIHLPT